MKLKTLLSSCLLLATTAMTAHQYWQINPEQNAITWTIQPQEAHADHLEMAGKRVSIVFRYKVDEEGRFLVEKSMNWPMLRTIPNNTHATLMRRFKWNMLDAVTANNKSITEKVTSVSLNGTLHTLSTIKAGTHKTLSLSRYLFPSTDKPALVELYTLTNTCQEPINIEIPQIHDVTTTDQTKGVYGAYTILLENSGALSTMLQPGQSITFSASISGYKPGEAHQHIDAEQELKARMELVKQWQTNLVLESPNPTINTLFSFSKIRACESIFETKSGPMHGPGGESYYAAVWANDQAEYANPFFPFVGYPYASASAVHSFDLFAQYMNKEYKPIPSSIIAEGYDYWNGAGDRGDAAMIAYGASRFALENGSKEEAEHLWPLITWCLEYCHRNLNEAGVVKSDHDELEGRFPAGTANLCTSSLYYDALLSTAYLSDALHKSKHIASQYRQQAATLAENLDRYFHATVEGFDTYRYYDGNTNLRSWICIPLTMGIKKRAEGTIQALFSPKLWTQNGLLTASGDKTFWDRTTLYGLRGAFAAGYAEKAYPFLKYYSEQRLTGDHVPYAIEAWPEGEQRHLSAESALYARIITEGIFGIRPIGLKSFQLTPHLPQAWSYANLKRVHAFGDNFDILLKRNGKSISVSIIRGKKCMFKKNIKQGDSITCNL